MLIPEATCQAILRILEDAPRPDLTAGDLLELLGDRIRDTPELLPACVRGHHKCAEHKTFIAALRLLDDRGLVAPATDNDAILGFAACVFLHAGALRGAGIGVRITWSGHCVLQAYREQQGAPARAAH